MFDSVFIDSCKSRVALPITSSLTAGSGGIIAMVVEWEAGATAAGNCETLAALATIMASPREGCCCGCEAVGWEAAGAVAAGSCKTLAASATMTSPIPGCGGCNAAAVVVGWEAAGAVAADSCETLAALATMTSPRAGCGGQYQEPCNTNYFFFYTVIFF